MGRAVAAVKKVATSVVGGAVGLATGGVAGAISGAASPFIRPPPPPPAPAAPVPGQHGGSQPGYGAMGGMPRQSGSGYGAMGRGAMPGAGRASFYGDDPYAPPPRRRSRRSRSRRRGGRSRRRRRRAEPQFQARAFGGPAWPPTRGSFPPESPYGTAPPEARFEGALPGPQWPPEQWGRTW